MSNGQHDIEVFARGLEAALHALSAEEREDIVREARAHLAASAEAGRLKAALAAFGTPQTYALQFALEERTQAAGLRGAWSLAGNMAGSAVLALLAVAFVTVAIIDILVPAFGIWVNPATGAIYFGHAGMTTRAQELAGAWLSLASFAAAGGLALLSLASARAAAREARRYLKGSSVSNLAGETL